MSFGDLKTDVGLKALNNYLADRSYIEGYQPSQNDTATFNALTGSPSTCYPHALRWFKHIQSYGNDRANFPGVPKSGTVPAANGPPAKAKDDDDDDMDLFGSDDEPDAEADRVREERLKAYADKKSKKPGVIAKSNVILDVKPWDDETDMAEMEKHVRKIECDGLKWGISKLVPLAYGIKKLQIVCVVEDDKVSIDWLQEEIQNNEDFVQSVDIAAFQKI